LGAAAEKESEQRKEFCVDKGGPFAYSSIRADVMATRRSIGRNDGSSERPTGRLGDWGKQLHHCLPSAARATG
jgi:hypothetical protein